MSEFVPNKVHMVPVEGYLVNFFWDKGGQNKKSGIFFLRKYVHIKDDKYEHHDLYCRAYGKDANLLAYLHKMREQAFKNKQNPKNYYLYGMGDWFSFQQNTGEQFKNRNGVEVNKTKTTSYIQLKDIKVINKETREIILNSENYSE